jgi:eukaryotic-like serine/threonine-protein kinase
LEESEDQQLFIVMAYYEGETLTQRINRGIVSVRDSLDYAIQMARGLGAAHARNLVHRDIKPSNVIITNDNLVKIVDFGLARAVASVSATQSVSNTGTLPYMAPEQILGEPVDQRADVWALGVIIVQMLTGSHPFLRPNASAMSFLRHYSPLFTERCRSRLRIDTKMRRSWPTIWKLRECRLLRRRYRRMRRRLRGRSVRGS